MSNSTFSGGEFAGAAGGASELSPSSQSEHSANGKDRQAQARAAWTSAVGEAKQSVRLTAEQFSRAFGLGRSYWLKRLQERQAEEAEARLGQRLYDAGWGDAALRTQAEQLQQKILNLKAAKKSSRGAEVELRGVYLRLAEAVLDAPPPAQAAAEHSQAMAEREKLRQRQEEVAQQRAVLLPADRSSRLRVASGVAVLAIGLLLVLTIAGPYVGMGPNLGPRASELVDTWTGKLELNMMGMKTGSDYTLEFRRDGRVKWQTVMTDNMGIVEAGQKMWQGTGEDDGGTGSWRVERVEDDTLFVHIVNDLNPSEADAVGWRIKFADDDHFTITGFDDMPVKFARQ
jgi:hypothetical protein